MTGWRRDCRRAKTILYFNIIPFFFLKLVFEEGTCYLHFELSLTNQALIPMVKEANVLGASVTFVYQHSLALLSIVPHFLESCPRSHTHSSCVQEAIDFIGGFSGTCETQACSIRIFHLLGHIKWFRDEHLNHVDPYKTQDLCNKKQEEMTCLLLIEFTLRSGEPGATGRQHLEFES